MKRRKELIGDGERRHFPMFAMDSVQRAVAAQGLRVTAGNGDGGLGLRRPGFRIGDQILSDAKQAAYEDYEHRLTTAWKGDAANEGTVEGAACIVRNAHYPDDMGAPGHLHRVGGRLICVPDRPRASGNDAMPLRDIETEYRLYSEEISQAWKGTPR
jgi:hypothetical protein